MQFEEQFLPGFLSESNNKIDDDNDKGEESVAQALPNQEKSEPKEMITSCQYCQDDDSPCYYCKKGKEKIIEFNELFKKTKKSKFRRVA